MIMKPENTQLDSNEAASSPWRGRNAHYAVRQILRSLVIVTVLLSPHFACAQTVIHTIQDLQNMANNLSGSYVLGNNIDASATSTWNSGSGFIPVGSSTAPFTGTLNGKGYTVTGLFISSG